MQEGPVGVHQGRQLPKNAFQAIRRDVQGSPIRQINQVVRAIGQFVKHVESAVLQ